MLNKIKVILYVFLSLGIQLATGQNNTNSPYTRYGYGELIDANSAEQRSMGGVGIASRNRFSINAINPASYSVVDSMNFMFDLGLSGLVSRFSNQNSTQMSYNSNLEYINLQFPINKWLGLSAGVLPFSFSGYNFFRSDSTQIPNNTSTPTQAYYTKTYAGNGGISQVYTGFGLKLFDHISLGVNAYYMFGNVNNTRSLIFSNSGFNSTVQENSIRISSFRFRYGLQFFNTFNKKHDLTLGLIYENKTPLNGSFVQTNYAVPADTVTYSNSFEMPEMLGAGLSYTFDKRLTLAVDYSLQKWGNTLYFSRTDSLRNRNKLSVGAEFIPDPRGRKYAERIRYRLGFNMNNPYFKIPGSSNVKNFGISFGMGLPLKTTNTVINTSLEYGKSGDISLFREDYLKFTLNAVFNEDWFFKRKL